jgi:hypothetical protein
MQVLVPIIVALLAFFLGGGLIGWLKFYRVDLPAARSAAVSADAEALAACRKENRDLWTEVRALRVRVDELERKSP